MNKLIEYLSNIKLFRKKPSIKFIKFNGRDQFNGKIRINLEFEAVNNDSLVNYITVAKFFQDNQLLYSSSSILINVENGINTVRKTDPPIPLSPGVPIILVFSCQYRKESGIKYIRYYFEDSWKHKYKGNLPLD